MHSAPPTPIITAQAPQIDKFKAGDIRKVRHTLKINWRLSQKAVVRVLLVCHKLSAVLVLNLNGEHFSTQDYTNKQTDLLIGKTFLWLCQGFCSQNDVNFASQLRRLGVFKRFRKFPTRIQDRTYRQ